MRIFIGVDPRQPVAAQVLAHSIWERSSNPVSISLLKIEHMPSKRIGLTAFSFSRYCVPHICGYSGRALFMDADMLCLGDICELEEICDPQLSSVCVVKNPKLRFEWPSLMYFNNAHCKGLTLDVIDKGTPQSFEWAQSVGEIPSEWNHLVGYDRRRKDAKVVHFTQGIPCFPEVKGCEYEKEWNDELALCNGTVGWGEIMGDSVHAKAVLERARP